MSTPPDGQQWGAPGQPGGPTPPPYGQPTGQPYGQGGYGQGGYGQPDPGRPEYAQGPGLGGPNPSGRPPAYPPGPGQPPYGQGGFPPPPGRYPGPYGPPYPSAPSAPPPRSRRNLLLAIGGAVAGALVILLVAGFVFGAVGGGSPRETAAEFMTALQAKDIDKAHGLLCRDGRKKQSKEALRGSFNLDARTITGYTLGTERTREREGNEETLVPVTISYDQGDEVRLDLGLWREGGQKVCSINPPGEG